MAERAVAARGVICFACRRAQVADVFRVQAHGAPPPAEDHNIVYGHIRIGQCPGCNSLQIEFLNHDCFDFASVWDQFEWYLLDRDANSAILHLAACCPDPLDPACGCPVHQQLREACGNLPITAWSSSLEAERHIHHLRLSERNGRLQVEPADAPPDLPATGS